MTKQVPFIRAHCESCGGPLGTPDETGRVICPYCGTVYRLKAGEKLHAAH